MSDLPPELKRDNLPPVSGEGPPPLKMNVSPPLKSDASPELTTDCWPNQKILKYILLPKPKGSPKAGKKEIGLRVGIASVCGVFAYFSFFGSSSLPGCNSGKTKDVVERIINDLPLARAGNTKYVTLKEVEETGHNKNSGVRSCSATLVSTAGEDSLIYSVSWQDRSAKTYLVQARIK